MSAAKLAGEDGSNGELRVKSAECEKIERLSCQGLKHFQQTQRVNTPPPEASAPDLLPQGGPESSSGDDLRKAHGLGPDLLLKTHPSPSFLLNPTSPRSTPRHPAPFTMGLAKVEDRPTPACVYNSRV